VLERAHVALNLPLGLRRGRNEVEDPEAWIEVCAPVREKYGAGYEDLIADIDAMR
jgi:hypothetical protein